MQSPALLHVMQQIEAARVELSAVPPAGVDWAGRAVESCDKLVPWLEEHARGLATYVAGVMNSPVDVREAVEELSKRIPQENLPVEDREVFEKLRVSLLYETLLIDGAGGAVVSKLIEKYLIENSVDWKLESNGASDYPDLFFRDIDYSMLPRFQKGSNQVYGAALKGDELRPVRVPDGLEIKTCDRRFAVDCHHAHVGLHLVLIFGRTKGRFIVNDIQIAFLRGELYRITKPSSPTTTLKASFNGLHFVSILNVT